MKQDISDTRRERLLKMLAAATFVIFFQGDMVAPIIPALSSTFGSSVQTVGLIVPAYLIPYGIATLAYGVLADRIGIHRVMFASLAAFSALTVLTAMAQSIEQLALWRIVTGIGASGVVPLALTLVGRLYPYEQRGRPLGWLFGAMAGGMAFGSPLGAMIVPVIGWQGLFIVVGAAGAGLLLVLLPYRSFIAGQVQSVTGTLRDLLRGYADLLGSPRGQRTYGYVLVNSMFHSGVFTWLGVYFEQKYHLGARRHRSGTSWLWRSGLCVRAGDRSGRGSLGPSETDTYRTVPWRLGGGSSVAGFPTVLAPLVAMVLSLGYDMTQPLFGGIVTSLGGKRAGQAMGLNVFTLFVGFGLGSFLFGELLRLSFAVALSLFAGVEFFLALLSLWLFRSEVPAPANTGRG